MRHCATRRDRVHSRHVWCACPLRRWTRQTTKAPRAVVARAAEATVGVARAEEVQAGEAMAGVVRAAEMEVG